MTTVVLLTGITALLIGGGVLWANPRRFANQIYAGLSVLCFAWCLCVFVALRADEHGAAELAVRWLIADNIVAAFFPWGNWLLKESLVVGAHGRLKTFRRSLLWFAIGLCMVPLTLCSSFITAPVIVGGQHQRGVPYFAYVGIQLVAQLTIAVHGYRQLREQTGIRRMELRFLLLNIAVTSSAGAALNGLGSAVHKDELKLLSFPVIIGALAITGWAITVYRIFDARRVLFSLGQRIVVISIIALGTVATIRFAEQFFGTSTAILVSSSTGIVLALWLDKASRSWCGLDGQKELARLRFATIELSCAEPSADRLVSAFETLLREHGQTTFAFVQQTASIGDIRRSEVALNHTARTALALLGWATPESLHRRRSGLGVADLQRAFTDYSLGLLVSIPPGSPTPSLIVALGTKINHGPFTFPEVERIINVAELMDNILARSRLTTQAALQAKTEHLAMMSRGLAHDLKNLITPISSFLVHRERHIAPGTAEAEVHEAAQRSVRVITDYVGEALFFSNRLTPRVESVDLPTVFAAVQDVTRSRATTRGVSLVTRCEPPVRLVADAVLVQRMLANLVNNAIDASPAGSEVVLSAKSADRERVQFTVEDRGSGIGAENLKRIFDPYFTTKEFGDEVRGFGLGLTICQKIVALHHGTIAVESRVAAGTCVTVDLPANPPVTTESVSTRSG